MFRRKGNQLLDGRKYRLAIICLLVLLAGFGVAMLSPVFANLFSELVTAVLGILFVYNSGNVANKWAVGKKGGLIVSSGSNVQQGPPPPAAVKE